MFFNHVDLSIGYFDCPSNIYTLLVYYPPLTHIFEVASDTVMTLSTFNTLISTLIFIPCTQNRIAIIRSMKTTKIRNFSNLLQIGPN